MSKTVYNKILAKPERLDEYLGYFKDFKKAVARFMVR